MRFRPLLVAFALALLVAAGCGPKPINESKTLTLDTQTTANSLQIPAQKKAVKLTVEFTSSTGEVLVLVYKDADASTDEAMMTAEASKSLGSKKGKDGTFTVDVPENTATRVVVRQHTAPKTDVALKVSTAK